MKVKKQRLEYIGFILPLLLALICLLSVSLNNHQAMLPILVGHVGGASTEASK